MTTPGQHRAPTDLTYVPLVATVAIGLGIAAVLPAPTVTGSTTTDVPRSTASWQVRGLTTAERTEQTYTHLLDTPGALVAATDTSIVRLDPADLDTPRGLWRWQAPGTLCDAKASFDQVLAVTDQGSGCTQLTLLDAASGGVLATDTKPQLADPQAQIVAEHRNLVGIATPHTAITVDEHLNVRNSFGTATSPYRECDISDIGVSDSTLAVSAMCAGDVFTQVRALPADTDQQATVTAGTITTQPVSIAIVSEAQMQFVVPGTNNTVTTWQLDKQRKELASTTVAPGNYGIQSWDFPGFGYTWRIGDTLHLRYGSEDITQSHTVEHVTGNPVMTDQGLLVPTTEGIALIRTVGDAPVVSYWDEPVHGREFNVVGTEGFIRGDEGHLHRISTF